MGCIYGDVVTQAGEKGEGNGGGERGRAVGSGEKQEAVAATPSVPERHPSSESAIPQQRAGTREPVRISIEFSTKSVIPVKRCEKNESYCASGYVFRGVATVYYKGTDDVRTFEVQTGGWMHAISPFYRAGNRPAAEDVERESYIPTDYPDTAFPNLATSCTLSTKRGGVKVDGFSIMDYPNSTGRIALFLHLKERDGTEGCISTDSPEWEVFCEEMEVARRAKVKKIPLIVTYTCELPDATRNMTQSHFRLRINDFDTKITR